MADEAKTPTQDASASANAPDEFDLALQERIASDLSSSATVDDDKVVDPNPKPEIDTKAGSDAEAAEKTPAAAEKAPAGDASSQDIWADAPAHLKEAYEAAQRDAEYRINSVRGRVSALDRQVKQLQTGKPEQQDAVKDKPEAPVANKEDPFDNDEIRAAAEDYPDVVGPLAKQNKDLLERVQRLEAPIQQLNQDREADVLNQQVGILEAAHPDWRKYTEDDRYPGWLASQPLAFRQAGERAQFLEDGAEAVWLLGEFKRAIGAGVETPAADPGETRQDMGHRRERQLAAGRDGGRSTPPVSSGVPDDFDAAASHAIAQKDRQARR